MHPFRHGHTGEVERVGAMSMLSARRGSMQVLHGGCQPVIDQRLDGPGGAEGVNDLGPMTSCVVGDAVSIARPLAVVPMIGTDMDDPGLLLRGGPRPPRDAASHDPRGTAHRHGHE